MPSLKTLGISAVFVAIFLLLICPIEHYGDFATIDFIEYWSAFEVSRAGGNPYDEFQLQTVQSELGRDGATLMMWNPPWALLLMSPILSLAFIQSAAAWGLFSLIAIFACIAMVIQALRAKEAEHTAVIVGVFMSYPLYLCISTGQAAMLITLGLCGMFWALQKKRFIALGLFALLLTIKPHLVLPVFLALFWWSLREKRWDVLSSFFIGLLVLVAGSELILPGALSAWIEHFKSPNLSGAGATAYQWKTATLSSWLSGLLSEHRGVYTRWPMALIPATALLWVGFAFLNRKLSFEDPVSFGSLICISAIATPFGWVFDYTMLLLPQALLFVFAIRLRCMSCIAALATLQFLLILLRYSGWQMHHYYFWYPLVFACVWVVFAPRDSRNAGD